MNPRAIDPTRCWLHHVRRGAESDDSATRLGRVWFVRDDRAAGADGLNGVEGWSAAECTAALSDDGSFTITLPNTVGGDGVLHRRRFRCLTDEAYEPGEEWIEVWSDADPEHPLFVGTPTFYTKTRSTIVLRGVDLTGVLAGTLTSDVDVWDAAAPADVIEHYSRLPVLVYGHDALTVPLSARTPFEDPEGWSIPLDGVALDAWEFEARLRITAVDRGLFAAPELIVGFLEADRTWARCYMRVQLDRGVVIVEHDHGGQDPTVGARGGSWRGKHSLVLPGQVAVRLVVRHEQIYAYLNGEMVAEGRIDRRANWPAWTSAIVRLTHFSREAAATGVLDAVHIESLAPFATRGPSARVSRRLPGILPATGLRALYWSTAHLNYGTDDSDARVRRLWPVGEESEPVERVEPTINFPVGTADWPPNVPGGFAARWSGAIYLDLETADRQLRITGLEADGGGPRPGPLRVYVGRTRRGEEAIARWWRMDRTTDMTATSPPLRDWIGDARPGWYPIVIEFAREIRAAGIVLQDTALDGGGRPAGWEVVPMSRLSPLGVYAGHVRLEQPRTVLDEVAQSFGYQWRIEPRGLESGEFPGQLIADDLIGLQTDLTIEDDDVGDEAEVRGDAADVIDALSVDGAGIADPRGSGQLTVRGVDYVRASDHLALRSGYESLAEITEQPMLVTRVDSLLALRSSPNEQVGVRPLAQHGLVDTFPLTGDLARMEWRPGDAARLQLEQLDVVDLTPRQLTTVTWTPRPDALGIPTVGFRARPRSARHALRRLSRAIYGPRRNFQGGIVAITGSPGAGGINAAEAPGLFSYVPLPADPSSIVRVIAVVRFVTGTGWRLEVHGADLGAVDGAVPTAGRYDITAWIQAPANYLQTYARLIGGNPANSGYGLTLELWRRG